MKEGEMDQMWIDRIQTGIMIWENNLRNPKGRGGSALL